MNEFQNQFILKDEPYQCGLFVQVPNFRKNGSAFVLSGGIADDILVTGRTTNKEIRQGRYTRIVEISTAPFMKELRFNSSGKEQAYSFDIYVKAVIQVTNPIVFYQNKNIDVDAYFNKLFSIDVKQITRKYSILDYDGLDQELTQKLSAYNSVDINTGFSYQISVVDAEPSSEAKEYVQKASKQQLEAILREQARELAGRITTDYAEAVMVAVAEGKLSEEEAILKIESYKNDKFDTQLEHIDRLTKRGYLSEKQAADHILPGLSGSGQKRIEPSSDSSGQENDGLEQFFQGS